MLCHCRHRLVLANVICAERVHQSSSGRLVVARVVKASRDRVQDRLGHRCCSLPGMPAPGPMLCSMRQWGVDIAR